MGKEKLKRLNIRATLYDSYKSGMPTESLDDFILWAEDQLNKIPEEFRGTACIEFSAEQEDWGDKYYPSCTILYRRPETDEELAERENRMIQIAENNAVREKAQLAELIAKHGLPQ